MSSGGAIDYTADLPRSAYPPSGVGDATYLAQPRITKANLALDTIPTRKGRAEFRFSPAAATPIRTASWNSRAAIRVFGTSSGNGYTRGHVIEPGLGRDYFDLQFATYAAVPAPAASSLFTPVIAAIGRCGRHRR